MSFVLYPLFDDDLVPFSDGAKPSLRESVLSIQQSLLDAENEERRRSAPGNRAITFRMPVDLLERFDAVAEDAATGRSQLLRQVIAEYLCYVTECDVRYKGSLLTAHSSKRKPTHV